jgi:hypothetical protein
MGRFHRQEGRIVDRLVTFPLKKMVEHIPSEENKRIVETSAGLGLPHEQIGALIGIDDKTLRKHYRTELDVGKAKASAQIAKTLFSKAQGGDTTALIWWTKAQMRWAETQKQEVTGANGGAQEMVVRWGGKAKDDVQTD